MRDRAGSLLAAIRRRGDSSPAHVVVIPMLREGPALRAAVLVEEDLAVGAALDRADVAASGG